MRLTRQASEAELLGAARRYRAWFLRGGTTTIEAKSGYGLSLEAELKILRVIRQLAADGRLRCVPTFLGAHEVPDEYQCRLDAYADLVVHEMLPRVAAEGGVDAELFGGRTNLQLTLARPDSSGRTKQNPPSSSLSVSSSASTFA